MSVLEFIAALVRAIAWPVAAVFLVLILRSHIPEFLRNIRRVKMPGLEVELENAKSEVAEFVASVESGSEPELMATVFAARESPVDVINAYYGKLDQTLRSLVPEDSREGTFVEVLRKVQGLGVVSSAGAGAVQALRIMRNAALQQDEWTLTSGDAAEFALLVEAAIAALEEGR